MAFKVKPSTKERLENLVRHQPGPGQQAGPVNGVVRPPAYIYITSGSGPTWVGTVQAWDSSADAWVSYDTDVTVREANSGTLMVGRRYLGIRYGLTPGGKWV